MEDDAECRIVYHDWRKTTKYGFGWRAFFESQRLQPDMEIIFPDLAINHALFWLCL